MPSTKNLQSYTLFEVIKEGIISPWVFLGLSVTYLPSTILKLFRTGSFGVLLSPSKFKEAWFGTFWAVVGPSVRENAGAKVVPLLDGRTRNGRILDEAVGPAVSGTVIEVGPGSGLWVSVFSDRTVNSSVPEDKDGCVKPKQRSAVTKVYGVEPNPDMHPELHRRVREAGLEDVYEVVPVGIEELSSSGRVQKESVDCIVTVLCLCSIPDAERNIAELYTYLKPGGRWYFYEHVKAQGWQGWFINFYQGMGMRLLNDEKEMTDLTTSTALVNFFWPRCLGGCQLRRDTGETLGNAGPWTHVDCAMNETEPWFNVCPHIIGVFTK